MLEILFNYWGKAAKAFPPIRGQASGWHPLPYHCLDVAAVALAWLNCHPASVRWLAEHLGLSDEAAIRLVVFFAALHDVGKFADAFQGLKPGIQTALQGRATKLRYETRHDTLGLALFLNDFNTPRSSWFGRLAFDPGAWQSLAFASACHHGKPGEIKTGSDLRALFRYHFREEDRLAALSFSCAIARLFRVNELCNVPHEIAEKPARHASWLIAGVLNLADWVASGGMPYDSGTQPLGDYWEKAQARAGSLLRERGLIPAASAPERGVAELFPALRHPSPLQLQAQAVPMTDGPQLFILEDVTGAGKTEAALLLAQRLMARGLADGLYFALPTQATANAIYRRLSEVLARFFREGESISLILAHGARDLSPEFRRAVLASVVPEFCPEDDESPATVACNAWLADNRKKTFLADAGVGTLDQALLAVLHSRYQTLRLAGLARRVLVIDEVHAYDSYMSGLLEILLQFQAGLGGSVILLSATLGGAQRRKLVNAYARGLGAAAPALKSRDYPLLTHFPAEPGEHEIALATRPEVARRVRVELLHDEDAAQALLLQAARAGQCACWVRNTVFDAVNAWQRLNKEPGMEGRVLLFHARFAQCDRQTLEDQVLARFGKHASLPRGGWILIATQVVEQSLDLDFDHMVSDLAPIDLLIQRAGRIHRHCRDLDGTLLPDGEADRRGGPALHILTPAPLDAPEADWFTAFFPKAGKVYPHHGELWRSARLFRPGARRGWTMPNDARDLIESVFGDSGEDLPPALERNAANAEGDDFAQLGLALDNALAFDLGYGSDASRKWLDDIHTPTRLGEASTALVLARWDGERIEPWAEHGENAWGLSRISVATRSIRAAPRPSWLAESIWEELAENAPPYTERLVLRQRDGEWIGVAEDGGGTLREWRYSREAGLEMLAT